MSKILFIIPVILTLFTNVEAASPLEQQLKREKKFELNRPKAQEFHEKLMKAYQNSHWNEVVKEAKLLQANYPHSPLVSDAYYYMGVAYFNLGELEFANETFTSYLKESNNLRNFEDAVNYKYQIANQYEAGVKKRLFGLKKLPKVIPARDEALSVYDEVIAAMPRSEMAAQSLYKKASLLVTFEDYKDSIEMYQTLIRRFPKNSLAPKSYLAIANIYLKQCKQEYPDPALIELAEINLKKFQSEYPYEPLISDVKQKLVQIKAVFAEELYTMGNYYMKKRKYDSAFIYYKSVILKYSDTKFSELSYKQIDMLKKRSGNKNGFEISQS